MRSRTFLTVLPCVALALAACSSSGAKSSSSSPPAPLATTTVPAAQVAAQPSAGCTATTHIAPGEVTVNTTSGGAARWYFRHVPPSYTGTKPMPLVIDMHGYFEGAIIHRATSRLEPFGDAHGFITITPEGSGTKVPMWNASLGSPDVTFIGAILDQAEHALCVDQRRIFATGYSEGAFMTSAVACAYSDRIAAVAPVDGIRDITGCKFDRPVPAIAFHGTADPIVAYTGGLGAKALSLPTPDGHGTIGQVAGASRLKKGPSIPQITADWAKRNGCGTVPTEKPLTSDVTTISFPCPADAEVLLERVTGGGHSWPGSALSQEIVASVGKTTMTISADAVMWAFFEAHPLRS